MEIRICKNSEELGKSAAKEACCVIKDAIKENGKARIVLSTGASQFDTISSLVKMQGIDWSKVEMFHLDEYVDLPETHNASFRKYLKERFVDMLPTNLMSANFVDGTKEGIKELTQKLRAEPIDLGLIGIGENSHIAFNDPPADFNTKEAYIVVNLDEKCKKQQMGEGWFATIDDVPKQAVSMTPYQIMQCKKIISCVPYGVKSEAVKLTLKSENVDNMIPSTLLKTHSDFVLYIDAESAKQVADIIF